MKITPEQKVEMGLDRIRPIFLRAMVRLESLKPGERVAGTVLAQEIGNEMGVKWQPLYQILLYLFRGYPGFQLSKGAGGGMKRLPENEEKEND